MADEPCAHPRTEWVKSGDGKNATRVCSDCDLAGIALAVDLVMQGRTDGGLVIGRGPDKAAGED